MTPENVIKARMDHSDIEKLEQLARIERTTKSRIIRNSVLDTIAERLIVCPECGSANVIVTVRYCVDCGTSWEASNGT